MKKKTNRKQTNGVLYIESNKRSVLHRQGSDTN